MMSTEKPGPRQARELAQRLSWLTEAQAAAGWAVIIILAALLGAIYLNQASKIAAIGRRVQIEQSQLDEQKRINGELERLIAEAQGLERLNAEALGMGFRPATPDEIEYLVIPDYPVGEAIVPALSQSEHALQEAPAPADSMLEALLLAARGFSDELIRGQANEQ
jgi:hypothetical protein